MARGRGGKAKRGGGHSFSKDLALNEDGIAVSNERRGSARKRAEEDANRGSDDSGSEESEETEEESEEEEPTAAAPKAAATDASGSQDPLALRAAKKAKKQEAKAKAVAAGKGPGIGLGGDDEEEDEVDEEDLINPNHATPKTFKTSDLSSASREPSRREREAKEKKGAQDRYWKLHAAGKTDQAKTDLARLAAIRKQREEAAAQRKAEQEAKTAEIEAKKAASKQNQR